MELEKAAQTGDVARMKAALKAGADPNGSRFSTWPPICVAALFKQFDFVKSIHENGADVHATGYEGEGLMHHFSGHQSVEEIEWGLAKGLKLNTPDKLGRPPLYYAIRHTPETLEFIRYLVNKGADPNFVAYDGSTALDAAKAVASKEVIAELEKMIQAQRQAN